MNRKRHYEEAERLLEECMEILKSDDLPESRKMSIEMLTARAHVHATLASCPMDWYLD